MKIIEMKLSDIHPYERNPRRNDGAVDAVAESITSYGWKQPIVITGDGEIIAGHTRYKAAQKLGLDAVPCVIADDLSRAEAKAYRIADNKTSDFSIWDNALLLDELTDIGDDLFTGFVDGEMFDGTLDTTDNSVLEENESGLLYEVTFSSKNKEKINQIKAYWDAMEQDDAP